MEKTFTTNNAEETAHIACEFATTLKGGETIALIGSLGAGKTTFVQALAGALGATGRITSPTFVFMHVHPLSRPGGPKRLVHVDAYRGNANVLRGIGLEEYLDDPEATVLIEWADRTEELLPEKTIRIRFRHLGGDKREIEIAS